MNYVKETGVLVSLTEKETGKTKNGYDWTKQTAIVQVEDERDGKTWPRTLALTAFGNVCDFLDGINPKDPVEFAYYGKSREYNGKWYNDLNLVSIAVIKAENEAERPKRKKKEETPVAPAAPAPDLNAAQAEDDLPF